MREQGRRKLEFVASKIAAFEGVVKAEVSDFGVIEAVISGVNKQLREEILEVGKRAVMPVRVSYQLENEKVFTDVQLNEMGYFSPVHSFAPNFATQVAPCDTYAKDMLNFLKVVGPVGPDLKSEPVFVPGSFMDEPEAPPEEVAGPVDGALKLKRLRSKTRGRPVVGWKYGDKVVRVGSQLKVNSDCYVQWTMGRTLGLKPGMIMTVSDLSSRYPIVYGNIGDYTGLEIPVHELGRTIDLQIGYGDQNEEIKKTNNNKVLGSDGVRHAHTSKVECGPSCGCGPMPDQDDVLLKPKKGFKKKKK